MRISLGQLFFALVLSSTGLLCCRVNVGWSTMFSVSMILTTACVLAIQDLANFRLIIYASFSGVILVAASIVAYSLIAGGSFLAKPVDCFIPFTYPHEFADWNLGDALRQCPFSLGGLLGCGLGTLFSRRTQPAMSR